MAHFSQCGDIANVVMLMDGVSGQPKGSAKIWSLKIFQSHVANGSLPKNFL